MDAPTQIKTIVVYQVFTGEYRAYVKGSPHLQEWALTAPSAVRLLLAKIGENMSSVEIVWG